jgi:hypothetical protein
MKLNTFQRIEHKRVRVHFDDQFIINNGYDIRRIGKKSLSHSNNEKEKKPNEILIHKKKRSCRINLFGISLFELYFKVVKYLLY